MRPAMHAHMCTLANVCPCSDVHFVCLLVELAVSCAGTQGNKWEVKFEEQGKNDPIVDMLMQVRLTPKNNFLLSLQLLQSVFQHDLSKTVLSNMAALVQGLASRASPEVRRKLEG